MCHNCPTNKFTADVGRTSECDPCPSGKKAPLGSIVCSVCGAGRYTGTNGNCVDCPVGFAQPDQDQSSCLLCGTGRFSESSELGAASCTKCDPGKFGEVPGTCTACSIGFYSDGKGAKSCNGCSQGQKWISTNQPCQNCDLGKRGTNLNVNGGIPGNCTICKLGTYQDDKGQVVCKDCKVDRFGTIDGAVSSAEVSML